ncbi:MAG: GIY-YIG nuclease family protein [Kiritimatiellaeota bacterium]|nr:GIY-YIG nuclease family protein [Kiritimatiellota bacterium]
MCCHYVYILESESLPGAFYVGFTDLPVEERLAYHNRGKVLHTARRRPWRIKTYLAFTDRARARRPGGTFRTGQVQARPRTRRAANRTGAPRRRRTGRG